MDLNNLIQKIINIDFKSNNIKITKLFFFLSIPYGIGIFLSLFCLYDYSQDLAFIAGLAIYFFTSIFIIYIDNYLTKRNNLFSNFLFNLMTKKIKLTKEEKEEIKKITFSHHFNSYEPEHTSLLDSLINKNISTLDYKNLEEFLLILKNNKLHKKYLDKICDKITNNQNLMQIAYYQNTDMILSKEELLLFKFLSENIDIRPLIIKKLYNDCSFEYIKENKYFLNELSIDAITNKILEKYTLKEIAHSLFSNTTFSKNEIYKIFQLLNDENQILIKKYFINKVLSENDTTIIENCYSEFFNIANSINIENKQKLYLLKSKFPDKQLITNDNFKIIHI